MSFCDILLLLSAATTDMTFTAIACAAQLHTAIARLMRGPTAYGNCRTCARDANYGIYRAYARRRKIKENANKDGENSHEQA